VGALQAQESATWPAVLASPAPAPGAAGKTRTGERYPQPLQLWGGARSRAWQESRTAVWAVPKPVRSWSRKNIPRIQVSILNTRLQSTA